MSNPFLEFENEQNLLVHWSHDAKTEAQLAGKEVAKGTFK